MKTDEAQLYEASHKFRLVNLIELALELGICNRRRAEYLVRKLARTNKTIDAEAMIADMRDKDLMVEQMQMEEPADLDDQPEFDYETESTDTQHSYGGE